MKIATAFPPIKSFPDPVSIVTPAEWYFLNHVSSGLIQFDHREGRFKPLLAESWEIDEATYRFKLKPNLQFSDGSPLDIEDVAKSIKRQIFKNTSTHFRLGDYFKSCTKLRSIDDSCDEIKIIDDRIIEFKLPKRFESFVLFLASPEGAVWSKEDLISNGDLIPRRFSGPYLVSKFDKTKAVLLKNLLSPITKEFPEAPQEIEIFISGCDPVSLFRSKKIDLYIEMTRPFYEEEFVNLGLKRFTSPFNTILYLFRVAGSKGQIGAEYFKALWKTRLEPEMTPANTFLPFGSLGALTEEKFLSSLPLTSNSDELKIAVPTPFFHPKMTEFFDQVGAKLEKSVNFEAVQMEQIYDLYSQNPRNPGNYDFVLTPYVASERFPSVQINFMLEGKSIPLELENIDTPDSSSERISDLEAAQVWLLSSQTVLPLVFVRNQILTVPTIELGDQPMTDAEIHLWKVLKPGE